MKKIIFTDLDGTLTLRDTYNIFIFHNITLSLSLKNALPVSLMTLKFLFGILNKEGVKRASFKMYFTNYDTKKDIGNFLNKIPWNKPVINRIKEKQADGYKVILVTASPDPYLHDICKHLGYDGFLATKTLHDNGILQGTFDGAVCNYDEKVTRIKEFLGTNKPSHTISFGNSKGDYPMLKFCDESYFVHKSNITKFDLK